MLEHRNDVAEKNKMKLKKKRRNLNKAFTLAHTIVTFLVWVIVLWLCKMLTLAGAGKKHI